jgi:hypothetical protein
MNLTDTSSGVTLFLAGTSSRGSARSGGRRPGNGSAPSTADLREGTGFAVKSCARNGLREVDGSPVGPRVLPSGPTSSTSRRSDEMADLGIVQRRPFRLLMWPAAALLLVAAMWLFSGVVGAEADLATDYPEYGEHIQQERVVEQEVQAP